MARRRWRPRSYRELIDMYATIIIPIGARATAVASWRSGFTVFALELYALEHLVDA